MKKIFILLGLISVASYVFALSLQKDSYGKGMTSASEMRNYSFDEKGQLQQAIDGRISELQKQKKEVKSANRDNWESVRDKAVQIMEGDSADMNMSDESPSDTMGGTMYQSQAGGSSSDGSSSGSSGTSATGSSDNTGTSSSDATGMGPRDTTGMDTNTSMMNDTNATMNATNSTFGNEMNNTSRSF